MGGLIIREPYPRLATGDIPRRLIATLEAYVAGGSHKAGAHLIGISESTSRQRISELIRITGARTTAEAVWLLREELGR
jgi:hypothetical protein